MVACAALAGCVSYGEMREREPALVVKSAKSPEVYLACITPAFADIWPGSSAIPDGDGWVVSTSTKDGYLATVTVRASGTGTVAEYRQLNGLTWAAFGRAREAVRACA